MATLNRFYFGFGNFIDDASNDYGALSLSAAGDAATADIAEEDLTTDMELIRSSYTVPENSTFNISGGGGFKFRMQILKSVFEYGDLPSGSPYFGDGGWKSPIVNSELRVSLYILTDSADPSSFSGGDIVQTLFENEVFDGTDEWGRVDPNPTDPLIDTWDQYAVAAVGFMGPLFTDPIAVLAGQQIVIIVKADMAISSLLDAPRGIAFGFYGGEDTDDAVDGTEYLVVHGPVDETDPTTYPAAFFEIGLPPPDDIPDTIPFVESPKLLVLNFVDEKDPYWMYNAYGDDDVSLLPQCVQPSPSGVHLGSYLASILIGSVDPTDGSKGYIMGQYAQNDGREDVPTNYAVDILQDGDPHLIESVMILKEFAAGDPTVEKIIKDLLISVGQTPVESVGDEEVTCQIDVMWDAAESTYDNVMTETFGATTNWKPADIETFQERYYDINLRSRSFKIRMIHVTNINGVDGNESAQKGRLYFNGIWINYAIMNHRRINFS